MRKWMTLLLIVLMMTGSATASVPDPLAPAPERTVTVTVVGEGGGPLPEATIHLLMPGQASVTQTATDRNGQAVLPLPDGFSYWLRAWAEGYALAERPYVPETDGPVVTLTAVPYRAELTGIVTDDRGLPVPGVRVTAWVDGLGLQGEAVTEETGLYRLPGLRARDGYVLQAEAKEYQPLTQTGIALAAGDRTEVDLTLAPVAGTVTGEVTDSRTGRPAAGVTAELILNGWGVIARTTTDGDGYFAFAAPSWGQAGYQVRLSKTGYEILTTGLFAVAPGGWVDYTGAQRLSINPLYAELAGSVLDDSGNPLAETAVELQGSGLGTIETAATDTEGFFRFTRLPAGTYRVRAVPRDDRLQGASGWVTLEGGQRASADAEAGTPDKTNWGSSAIVGTVRDHLGDPVEGAVVVAQRGAQAVTATTDSQGRYRLPVEANVEDEAVEPETSSPYRVAVSKDGFLPTDQQTTADGAPSPGDINVRAKATNRADFTLQPAIGALAGRVLDDRGRPVAGVTVVLRQEGAGEVARATTTAAGTYRFTNLPVARQANYLTTAVSGAHFESGIAPSGALIAPAALTPGGTVTQAIVLRRSTVRVTGIVHDGDRQPAAGQTVTVIRPGDGQTYTAVTGAGGAYSVAVAAGPAHQYLVRAGGAAAAAALAPGAEAGAVATVELAPKATLEGKVWRDGHGSAGIVEVALWAEGAGAPLQTITSDRDGFYRFTGLEPGRRYSVAARMGVTEWTALAPGEPVITPLLMLEPGQTYRADLTVQPGLGQ